MSNKNFIEIKGKRYDTETGAVRHAAKHYRRHEPAHSKILMRQVVKRPSHSHMHQIKAQGAVSAETQMPVSLAFTPTTDKRLERARHVRKSHRISHFGSGRVLIAAPSNVTSSPEAGALVRTTVSRPTYSKQILTLQTRPSPSTADMLEKGLREATSHEQKPLKKPRKIRLKTFFK